MLNSILRGLVTYSVGIFIVLVIAILVYARRFATALREWQKSVFGLERSLAQRKLVKSTTSLTLLLLLIIGEFLVVTVAGPQMPSIELASTPTIDPFAAATATLTAAEQGPTPIPTPTVGQESLVSECIEGVKEITSPGDGDTVSGTVELIGSVNVENFGSYKYEYSQTGAVNWTTIAAGNQLRLDESLGFWYTSSLTPGTYLLQLVPLDNTGAEMTPCIISIEVAPAPEG
ncbi:MAG: hypothetical protein SVR81_06585 [Chloroflexota bacterium]|nr:hypothetical protein [Chloroflexota bacterium]